MEFEPIIKISILVSLILTIGLLGRTRRIGFLGAVILAIILTPIGGFLIALISGPRPIHVDGMPKAVKPAPSPAKTRRWFSRAT
jgi:hypothetical protein